MKILFRADSSSSIGTGHIMRDLVLAKQFKDANIIFATQNLSGNINYKIKEAGYKVELLYSSGIDELDKLIKKYDIDMIVIDHYDIDYEYEKKLKAKNPSLKVMVLDDIYKRHSCDILLNHNIYADEKRYKDLVPSYCKIKCGEKYTLIRDEFYKEKEINQKRFLKQSETIFIAMGGSDILGLNFKILKILEKLKKTNKNLKVNLVTTSANKRLKKLKNICKNKKWIHLHINAYNIAELMNNSFLGIVTASVTANEIYFLDKKFIAIKVAQNQQYMYEYLKKRKKALPSFNEYKIYKVLKDSLKYGK